MRTNLLIFLFLTCSSISVNAQRDTASYQDFEGWIVSPTYFYIFDSLGKTAQRDTSGNWDIVDAKRSLEVVYKLFLSENDKESALLQKLYAAQEILFYIKPDGTITNWKKWTEAVKKYQALIQPAPKQPLKLFNK